MEDRLIIIVSTYTEQDKRWVVERRLEWDSVWSAQIQQIQTHARKVKGMFSTAWEITFLSHKGAEQSSHIVVLRVTIPWSLAEKTTVWILDSLGKVLHQTGKHRSQRMPTKFNKKKKLIYKNV
jgi:hypothetical protein